MRVLAPSVASLLVAAVLTGCGGEEPAVCGSLDRLEESIDVVRDLDLTADDDLQQLTTALQDVQAGVEQVVSDAGEEYAEQIQAVQSSYDALRSTAEAVRSGTSDSTLAEAGAQVAEFGTAVETFAEDLRTTC